MISSIHPIPFQEVHQLATMAKEIWYEYYLSIITQEQIDYMLERFYNREKLEQEWNDGVHFLFLGDVEKPCGFLSISEQAAGNFFIHKFYVKKEKRGEGIGSKAFLELIQQMPEAKEIRLQVNRKNIASINFYFKNGFKIEKWADFEIGNGYEMNDFIMLWKRL
jgi:ribosomal protein S18 acetylase RimI-like enzyme